MFILYFLFGVLTSLFVLGLIKLNKRNKLSWIVYGMTSLGFLLFLFAIAWSVSSIGEGEPRAASMGMVVFGIPAVILMVLGFRLSKKPKVE